MSAIARYSGARWRPLSKDTNALTADDLVLQLHTMVGGLSGTDRYFRTVSVFSHFGVGGKWGADEAAGLDGVVYQWGDTSRRAAASLNGNRRTISVETADNAARPIQPWTDKQCDALVGIMVWAHREHGIPLVLIPDSKPGRTGIGFHRMGCDPYRVDGGELWSSSFAKDCPTQARIAQIPELIARARAVAAGTAPTREDLTIVDAETKTYLDGKFKALDARVGRVESAVVTAIYGDSRTDLPAEPADTHPDNLQTIRREVGELRTLVDARLPEPPPDPA